MAEAQDRGQNIFSVLRRAFSTDVIIRNTGTKKQLTVLDPGHIQTAGVIQTNSLIDRFHKVYTTSTAYGVNLNLAQNYQSARVQIYADYDAMDTDAIISSALDIISDECTLSNDNDQMLSITSPEENIQNELENLFYSVLNIEFNLWSWIRSMCKYGDHYLKLEIAEDYGVYNVIPFSAYNIVRQEGFNPENPNEVRFKFDPNAALGSTTGYTSAYNNQDPGIWFDNYEMAHFRLLGDVNYLPYGRSYLENSRKLFKQYTLIEDAMLIHRIVRAPERRVFYVNIGSIPPHEVDSYIQKMIQRMKKAPLIDPQTGQYNLKYNQQNLLEDFIIPMRGNDSTTKIDTAKGLEYNAIDDVVYFREKLFAALKIPKAFMGYEKDLSGKATLAAEDIRFARTIERLQRIVCSELKKIAIVHLLAKGYDENSIANFDIKLTKPSIIYEQERIAMFKEKVDLTVQAMEGGILPRNHMWKHVFKISEDEFFELDDMIIEDQKRKFRYAQIAEEGNDPSETGQAFGTPHQLASLYGGKMDGSLSVPSGYDFSNPSEPLKVPGRPQKYKSTYGTDESPFGRDRLGTGEMSSKTDDGEDGTKVKFRGGPLNNENAMSVYLQNKKSLDAMKAKFGKKTTIYKVPDLLNEDNIRQDLD